jgi:LAO/AO transport system kinase
MEIADVFLINKADHPGAAKLESEIEAAIGLAAVRERPPVRKVVASEGIGIVEALDAILAKVNSKSRRERAVASWKVRLREMFRERLTDRLPVGELDRAAADVATRQRDPYSIVNDWLKRI